MVIFKVISETFVPADGATNSRYQTLDVDKDKSDNALKSIIINEPKLDKQMDRLNKLYLYGLSVTAFVYMINMILMINILYQDYHF